jgi:putative DNA primase/helicase
VLFKEEGPAILGWLVRGFLEWQRIGLGEPAKILEAIKSYRSEQDVVGDFLGQCCETFLDHPGLRDQARVKAADLYTRYVDWCKENGEKTYLTNRRFGSEMTRRGFPLRGVNGCSWRYGMKIRGFEDSRSVNPDSNDSPY